MPIASLPMYDLPGLRRATDLWWAGLAQALTAAGFEEVPARLERRRSPAQAWCDPHLLLGQTCGYPLTHDLKGRVCLVATPVYTVEGCEGALYRSAFLVRADDPAETLSDLVDLGGRRVVVNGRDSQSGYNCLRHALAPLAERGPLFSEVLVSGGHGASLAALCARRADLAAVDCVTWALTARNDPAAVAGLRVLTWSAPAPALPYITRAGVSVRELAALRQGLEAALAAPGLAAARRSLGIGGFEILPLSAYDAIDAMEAEAKALGYPDII